MRRLRMAITDRVGGHIHGTTTANYSRDRRGGRLCRTIPSKARSKSSVRCTSKLQICIPVAGNSLGFSHQERRIMAHRIPKDSDSR